MKFYFNKHSKLKLLAVICITTLFSHTAYAAKDSYKAIETCTLSQNVLTNQLLIGMAITYSDPKKDILLSDKQIKTELKILKKRKLTKKLHKKAVKLNTSWHALKDQIEEKVTKDKAFLFYTQVNKFSTNCYDLVKQMNKTKRYSDKFRIAALNLKVQTLKSLYILKSWNSIDKKFYLKKVNYLVKAYHRIYKKLNSPMSKINKTDLKEINKEFKSFKFMLTSNSGRYIPMLLSKKASMINDLTTKILKGK